MKKSIYFTSLLFLFTQCNSGIKNKNAKVEQESGAALQNDSITAKVYKDLNDSREFWVGYFKEDLGEDQEEFEEDYIDDYYYWERVNKISISIDTIIGETAFGHSVVAGNERPFTGSAIKKDSMLYFEVKEPGDNKYDGAFSFQMNDTMIEGTWQAYGKIDIPKRKYKLKKRVFKYEPERMLVNGMAFVDYNKSKVKYDKENEESYTSFASATDKIYKINASNRLLTKKNVENLKRGDLQIIRNSIYARHGYSFKNRALRVFFDAQDWYIPVYADIKSNLTDIEKKNIELFMRYEKNAKEYYDYFGR